MGEWREITEELCDACYYRSMFDSGYKICDYIGIERHSRIFENGKRKPETFENKCDCFRPKTDRKKRRNVWKEEGKLAWKVNSKKNIPIASDAEDD